LSIFSKLTSIVVEPKIITMTFLQSTLGKNYKWIYIMQYGIKYAGASYFMNIMDFFGNVAFTVTLMYLWSLKLPTQEIFTYLLIGRIYKSVAENYFYNGVASEILTGLLTSKLLNSTKVFSQFYATMIGRRVFRNIFELLSYVAAAIICGYLFIAPIWNLNSIFILILFIPITFTINHLAGIIVGSAAFFIDDKRDFDGIAKFWLKSRDILAGILVPLNLLPFSGFLINSPFGFILHHPMQIYLGKYSWVQILYTFLGGIAWCFVLWIVARVLFKFGLKKNEAVGL
jgi:ABC-type uncharacterized transport system permease subunit